MLANGNVLQIPVPLLFVVAVAITVHLILKFTKLGRPDTLTADPAVTRKLGALFGHSKIGLYHGT